MIRHEGQSTYLRCGSRETRDVQEPIVNETTHRPLSGTPWLEQAPVFRSGEEGYHTYRIPALAVTNRGTVLAFCEGRKNSSADNGDIDLLLRRSLDSGRTWRPRQTLWDQGEETIGNPCPVVDRATGTIWLACCRNNDRVYLLRSQDDGQTWSPPVEITASVKRPEWGPIGTGPGHGLQLRSGRLLIPCWAMRPDWKRPGNAFCIYSDDNGATWAAGDVVPGVDWGDECMPVDTPENGVYLSIRSGDQPSDTHLRAYSWSRDGGSTWSPVQWHADVPEPACCQGSAIRYTATGCPGRAPILLANPAGPSRERLTIRLSHDDCRTWSAGRVLHPGPSAYSDLALLPDGGVLCLYERGTAHPNETLSLARFNLAWLTAACSQQADGEGVLPQ